MDDRDATALGLADVLLERISPEERELLEVLGPSMVVTDARTRSDGALGFGVEEMAWLTVVVSVSKPVVDHLLEIGQDALTEVVKEGLSAWIDRLRGRSGTAAPTPPPGLPSEVAADAGRVAYRHAVALGLEEDRARLLGDAVTGSLVAPRS